MARDTSTPATLATMQLHLPAGSQGALSFRRKIFNSKRHVCDAGCFASDGEIETLRIIDVCGRSGSKGGDGQSFASPPMRAGKHGRQGGDATPAESGQHSAHVHLRLSTPEQETRSQQVVLVGRVDAEGTSVTQLRDRVEIGSEGYIFVRATGGRGGDGGRGGNGQPGAPGRRGRDATRFSSGTNGGAGGMGGDAGNPTDGARGGNGGNVSVAVNDRDTGLLMLIKGNLNGGDFGFAGDAGVGGAGGKGGRGGRSYHWTERQSYTDSQGSRRTRTIHRSNPGGRDGRPGRSGHRSKYRAEDGAPGNVGLFRIVVESKSGGLLEYPSPYDLGLISFDIASEYTILEPDSLISLDNIEIENFGGMPTPDNYTIRLSIQSDRWLIHDEVDLVMHQALASGERYTFTQHGLKIRLGDYIVDGPRRRPFTLDHPISPIARMESGICRPFRNFENGEEAEIRFPVELSDIVSLRSLAPGESTRLIFSILNVGTETLSQNFLHRALRCNIRRLGGDLDPAEVVFFDVDGNECDIVQHAFTQPIQQLDAEQSVQIEARLGLRKSTHVTPYEKFEVGIEIDLQRPGSSQSPDAYRTVDCRKTFIRVSEQYQFEKGSRFLLIANQKTSVNDIEKWTQLADYFGSGLDVWDVSYYGFFDLIRKLPGEQSLLKHWRGKTIIIPNNYFQTPAGRSVAFDQLAKWQMRKAAADFDINFYVVGDSRTGGENLLTNALLPVDEMSAASDLKTQKDFLREVERWNQYIRKSKQVVGGTTKDIREFADISLGAVHRFEIQTRTFLFQPDRGWLEKKAFKLQRYLGKHDPLHRWIVVHRYDSGDTDTRWGFFRKRQVGTLEVRRTLDSSRGSAVLYEVDGIDAINQDFISSKENKHGIFLALKFEDKVDRFIRLVSERVFPRYREEYIDRPLSEEEIAQIGNELLDSILVDIFNEQRIARQARTWGRSHVDVLMPKLGYLAERSLNYGVSLDQMRTHHASMDLLYDLIAHLHYIAYQSRTAWDSAWIPTSVFKRGRAVSAYLDNRAERILTSIFGRPLSWRQRASSPNGNDAPKGMARKDHPEGIERQLADREINSRFEKLKRRRSSLKRYTAAQDHPGLTYDPELLTPAQRVLTGAEFDKHAQREAVAAHHRTVTEAAVITKRTDLLVPLDTPTAEPVGKELSQSSRS